MVKRICKYCGNDAEHPRAHVWPQALNVTEPGQVLKLLDASGSSFVKRSQTGLYDDELWCTVCEAESSRLESRVIPALKDPHKYASPAFRADRSWGPYKTGDTLASSLAGIDTVDLHRFVLSVLWRCSASTKSELRRFALGPYEQQIRTLLRDANSDLSSAFEFVMRWEQNEAMRGGFISPVRTRYDGVSFVRFRGGAFSFDVKVSRTPMPRYFVPFCNASGRPVHLVHHEFLDSVEDRRIAEGAQRIADRTRQGSS